MTRMIDLHVHTTASDGTFTPSEVVSLAKKAGIAAVAITDHDTIDGVEEAVNKAKEENLELVPGVEISVGESEDIHIVGLYINHKDENPKNNNVDNLEWCTHKYNMNYGTRNRRISNSRKGGKE